MKTQFQPPEALPDDASKSAKKKYRLKMQGYYDWLNGGAIPYEPKKSKAKKKTGKKKPVAHPGTRPDLQEQYKCLAEFMVRFREDGGIKPTVDQVAKALGTSRKVAKGLLAFSPSDPSPALKRHFGKSLKKWTKKKNAWTKSVLSTKPLRKPDYPGKARATDKAYEGDLITTNGVTLKALDRYAAELKKWERKMKARGYTV